MKKEKISLKFSTMQSFVLCPFMVVVLDKTKKSGSNIITVSYTGVLSECPPIIGLAIRPSRYSHQLIREAGEFSLNLPSVSLLEDLDFCGKYSGKKYDKVLLRNIKLEPSEVIRSPIITEAPINLECKIRDILYLSKNGSSHDYFIADIVVFHRAIDFIIEKSQSLITANYDYLQLGKNLGKAFNVCKRKKGG
ncbi:MAG: flavin reductase family protein [bacterium]|nr:flavin reductase family protein [bacterium]